MTAPHQTAPDGSYVIGGGTYKFGQGYTEDLVLNLVMTGLRGVAISNISEATTIVEGLLRRVPLDALRMARPFILGATDADFATVDVAVDTIMKSLKIREIFATLGQVQTLIDDLIKEIVKIITGHENGLDALEQWWKQIAGLLGLLGNPDQLIATIQELLNRVWGLLTGTLTHPDKTLKDVVDALDNWVSTVFGGVKSALEGLLTNFGKLIDAIIALFGGTGTTVADAIAALRTWLTTVFGGVQTAVNTVVKTVQDLIDGLFALFGGAAGAGKTVTQVVAQIQAWLSGPFKLVQDTLKALLDGLGGKPGATVAEAVAFIKALVAKVQDIIDGITKIWSPTAGANNPLQSALDAITSILGVANSANDAASQAFARIESIIAANAGGYSDTFDVAQSTTMPAGWQKKNTTADSYGPNGKGDVVGYMSGMTGVANGPVWYVQTTKPVASADMKVTAVLSRTPWWTTGVGAVQSPWYLVVQANPTNQECYRVKISNDKAQFQKVVAGGTVSALGVVQTIPINATGTPYSLQIKAGVLTLFRGGVAVATHSGVTDLVGRCAGFGGEKVSYVNLLDNPLAQFAGIAWQPA